MKLVNAKHIHNVGDFSCSVASPNDPLFLFHHANVDRLKKKHEFHHIPNTETFVHVADNPEFDRILARDVSLSGPRRSVVVKSEETYDL